MPESKHDLLNNLFHHQGKELLAFAGWRAGDFSAEELVQEAYLRLLQHPELASISLVGWVTLSLLGLSVPGMG
jgi:DNA-directed RNA polymerase specialized sigma24 family protein